MSRSLVFIIASLACAFAFAGNQLTAEESEWANAAMPFSKEAVRDGLKLQLIVNSNPEYGSSPASLFYDESAKSCALIVRVRKNMAVEVLRNLAPTEHSWDVAKTVIFAHEYGHCVQYHVNQTRVADSPKRPRSKHEAFADVFALAWVYLHQPENFNEALEYIRNLRELPKSGTVNYNTHAYVRKAEGFLQMPNIALYTPYELAEFIVYGTPLSDAKIVEANNRDNMHSNLADTTSSTLAAN